MIRTANIKDIPEIMELMKSEPGFWNESWRDDALELGIDAANSLAFVSEDKGKIFGFACAHDLGLRAYLSELIISREYRNKGIGKGLIKRIENELSKRGCKVLISDVWKDSVEFYRSLGWSEPHVMLMRINLP